MTKQQANRLVTYLNKSAALRKQQVTAEVVGQCVVFSGPTGKHSVLYAEDSALNRILVHWQGYCENNGEAPAPKFGRYVAWFDGRNLVVGKLRQQFVCRSGYSSYYGATMWHVSRVRADGSVCTSNTHRLSKDAASACVL